MRLNIEKLQAGGRSFVMAAPGIQLPGIQLSAAQTATSAKVDSGKLLSDNIMKELMSKGLTNDVNLFMNKLATLESESDLNPITLGQIYGIYAEANKVIQHANHLNSAQKTAEKRNSFGDIAIDSIGRIITMDEKGKFSTKSITQFDATKDHALTIGEMIEQRKFNPQFTFNDNAASIIQTAEGMERINAYIKNILQTVGTTSDTQEAFHQLGTIVSGEMVKKPTLELQESIRELNTIVEQLGTDALFKVRDKLSSKNMLAAVNYIYSMLPKSMKQQLRAQYVVNGGDIKNSDKAITEIVIGAANMANDITTEHKVFYDQGINKAAGTTAGTKGAEKINLMTPLEILIDGSLNRKDVRIRTSNNPKNTLVMKGSEMPTLTNTKGLAIGMAPLTNILQTLNTMVDLTHMQIGDQKLTAGMMLSIVYDGAQVANVWAPVDVDGNVDLDLLKKLNTIQEKANSDMLSIDDLNKMLQEEGFGGYFDENRNYVGDGVQTLKFLVFTGITSGKIVDPNDNEYSYRLSKEESEGLKERMKQIYGIANKGLKKDARIEFPFQFWGTDYVAAPIFMKVDDGARNYAGAYAGHGPTVVKPTYLQQMRKEQTQLGGLQVKPSSNYLMME